ncbi:transcription factor 25 [Sitodiplosis mosellana]|uniref:transcription factor 25 n=1 Tax=Sitodiplosis mosellana TaxID=263140 RepID=UPI002444085A|nr:transcription factor 25 [Sitodiplosis mosellana]XP_055301820.1 transcription factor 25 [Sitodiplosis mosellana]XP_055301826.1 transcription factor 25 [Sitodiplosis mosellana]
MSSRVLKKLHGDNDLEVREQDASDLDNDNSFIGSSGARKKQFDGNRYDLFQQSMSESEVKEDDNETEHNSTATPNPDIKKKRKKRKKRSGKHSGYHRSSEDNADVDELARTFKSFHYHTINDENTPLPANQSAASNTNLLSTKALLSIQHKNLNPSFEMKRMFGSKVVQLKHSNDRRNGRGGRIFKSTWLVTPKDNWPPATKTGLSMVIDYSKSNETDESTCSRGASNRLNPAKGVQWFVFEHSVTYRQLQQKFLAAVESMDSDNIIKIINQQPYHVDSLIQMSELCKMSEDHAMASELIEHAILALESAFHSSFSLTTGNSRLDYRRQENRALFIVLFKHAQYLEGRACARTALEVAKLILTFDPINDPLAMILVIDYYALRAKQYEWLVQLYDELESSNNLSQLPNMAYSYALALFYLNKNGNLDLADKAIQYAVLMFPGVVKPLLDALSVQVDSRANSHKYISSSAYDNQPAALQQLTSLYVSRSKTVWRDTDILPWLSRNVNTVLDRVDEKDAIVNEYSTKRSQRYKTPPRPILRHIILSDFKEKVPLAPFINQETEPIVMYDPLPPLDSINIYAKPTLTPQSRLLPDASPLSMFFQSLLPNFNVQGGRFVAPEAIPGVPGARNADPNRDPAVAWDENVAHDQHLMDELRLIDEIDNVAATNNELNQPFIELRNSLTSVVDAMRDFLSNIRVPEMPNDADVDENESTDDGANDNYLT